MTVVSMPTHTHTHTHIKCDSFCTDLQYMKIERGGEGTEREEEREKQPIKQTASISRWNFNQLRDAYTVSVKEKRGKASIASYLG